MASKILILILISTNIHTIYSDNSCCCKCNSGNRCCCQCCQVRPKYVEGVWGERIDKKDKQGSDIANCTSSDEDSEDYYKDCPTETDLIAKGICIYLNNYVIDIRNEWKWTCIGDKSDKKIIIIQGESKAEILGDFDEIEKLRSSGRYFDIRIKIIDNKNWKYGENLSTIGELYKEIKQLYCS